MTLGVSSPPKVGSVINVLGLNTSEQTAYQVRSVVGSVAQLIDISTGEIKRMPYTIALSPQVVDAFSPDRDVLGNNTNNVSGQVNKSNTDRLQSLKKRKFRQGFRSRRYALRNVARRVLIGESPSGRTWRTCACGVVRQDAKRDVSVKYGDGRAHFTNLMLCGSVWTCPVCANKVTQERRRQIETINGALTESGNVKPVLLTYTLQHGIKDKLSVLLDDLKNCVRHTQGGRGRQDLVDLLGICGYVRATEIRVNALNGWHPHMHELLYVDASIPDIDIIQAIQAHTGDRYRQKLNSLGYKTNVHTFDVRIAKNIDSYLTKSCLELEMTDGNGKSGRNGVRSFSPFQLLTEIEESDDQQCIEWFREYAEATFRKRQITFSRGLLAKCGVDDKEDKEIVDDRDDFGRCVVSIPLAVWQQLVHKQMTAALLGVVETSAGSFSKVAEWLISHDVINNPDTVRPFGVVDVELHPP